MKAPNGLIYLVLALITLGIYAPALQSEFIGVDDPLYVTDNQHVQAGLTEESMEWAFTTHDGAIAIVAGDGDFTPLVDSTRRTGQYAIVLAFSD